MSLASWGSSGWYWHMCERHFFLRDRFKLKAGMFAQSYLKCITYPLIHQLKTYLLIPTMFQARYQAVGIRRWKWKKISGQRTTTWEMGFLWQLEGLPVTCTHQTLLSHSAYIIKCFLSLGMWTPIDAQTGKCRNSTFRVTNVEGV